MLYAPVPKKDKKKEKKNGKNKNDFVGERIKLFHLSFLGR